MTSHKFYKLWKCPPPPINYCCGNYQYANFKPFESSSHTYLKQCSPYLAVTSKIYSLQPLEGLLKLEKVDFKKNEVVIQSDSHKENE